VLIHCNECKNFDYVHYECRKTREKKDRYDGCNDGNITDEAIEFLKKENRELAEKLRLANIKLKEGKA